jgi:hypothetical protein
MVKITRYETLQLGSNPGGGTRACPQFEVEYAGDYHLSLNYLKKEGMQAAGELRENDARLGERWRR